MRYYRPWRLFLIWLSNHVPPHFEERILDYLYPDDLLVRFD
jgi:hypothetical protein